MSSRTRIKQNDTAPAFSATLKNDDGTVVDLTGATVVLHMRRKKTRVAKIASGAATVIAASAGQVSYSWAAGDTDTPGVYELEVQVTFADSTVRTFPSDGYHEVEVVGEVG